MNGNVESLVEKDEEYVLLDLDSVCFQADIPPNAPYVLSGLDTMNPILTIGKTLRLVGEYQETVGTCYVFSERGSSRADLDGEQQPMGDSNQASSDQISAIYLGETFCSYISINNSSSFEARDVVIKAEIQTERQRILLLDTSKAPVESIRSGGRYDFIVEHDVKELGPHTLVCTALYNDGDGDRKYLPQFFKFVVANPLSVRTKVRAVKVGLLERTMRVKADLLSYRQVSGKSVGGS
ncbi:hypothetical protein HPP92_028346 [Vanilla planifolia]|uniref:Transcription factor TFIIIC triple barrel domain-containing protein n=1 Tax=Vanilla planifolia TaxID=51239 RepID=A0A835U4B8_VANPL|nr:hypothetical protein HPP92_028346 [Vanilla planifolia]